MAALPKASLLEAMSLPGVRHIGQARATGPLNTEYFERNQQWILFRKPGDIVKQQFNETKYFEISDRLLRYTRKYLTNAAVMSYLLKQIGYEEPKKVLLLSPNPKNLDYMTLTLEGGLVDLGINFVINSQAEAPVEHKRALKIRDEDPEHPLTMEEFENARAKLGLLKIHGAGMVYGLRNNPFSYGESAKAAVANGENLTERIRSNEFDLVIYSEFNPAGKYPLWSAVIESVPPSQIVVVDGADARLEPTAKQLLKLGVHVFRREMGPLCADP